MEIEGAILKMPKPQVNTKIYGIFKLDWCHVIALNFQRGVHLIVGDILMASKDLSGQPNSWV